MQKIVFLSIAASTLLFLGACSYDLGDSCVDGEKRCHKNIVEQCGGSAWRFFEACGGDRFCDLEAAECKTRLCEDGARRCEQNTLEYCHANAWNQLISCGHLLCHAESFSCQPPACEAGWERCNGDRIERCNVERRFVPVTFEACGTNRCVENQEERKAYCVECTKNEHCDHALCLVGNRCSKGRVCEPGKTRCRDQFFDRCSEDGTTFISNNCAIKTSHKTQCHPSKGCVECTTNMHCGDDICDSRQQTCLPQSTIDWCRSDRIDGPNKISFGRVIPNEADDSMLTAMLLCGKHEQALSTYQNFEGKKNTDYNSYDGSLEYSADLSALPSGDYLCIWAFSQEGQATVACQKDETGEGIHDFNFVPTEVEAQKYKLLWDHSIDFENLEPNDSNYRTKHTIEIAAGIYANIFGRISSDQQGSIDGKSLVFSSKENNYIEVFLGAENNFVGQLTFDYKGWGNEAFKEGQEIVFFTNDETTANKVRLPSVSSTERHQYKANIQQSLKNFKITLPQLDGHSSDSPRLLIDNLRWTNHPPPTP